MTPGGKQSIESCGQVLDEEGRTELGAAIAERTRRHQRSNLGRSNPGAGCHPPYAGGTRTADLLLAAIEAEVIPRLVLAVRAASGHARPPAIAGAGAAGAAAAAVGAEEVATLVELVLARRDLDASAYIRTVQERGASIETIYLTLLTPAARRLGELWEQDLCDFTEVTMAMWRLHQVLRELGPAFLGRPPLRAEVPRALLVPLPGEQHTFGLEMLVQFFRRAGWKVSSPLLGSLDELSAVLKRDWLGVIGFSVTSGQRLDAVAAAIRATRKLARNPAMGVMVGGPAFADDPHLAQLVGADATAIDAPQAVLQAESLLALQTGSPQWR